MKVLVVEDEIKLAELLATYLQAAGFEVRCLHEGTQVMALLRQWPADLVLLDLMLPGRDGLDVCRDIRAQTNIPVIMVTARTEEIDRLLGLELGADDYICKPYSPREVVARVRAVLRRYHPLLAAREPDAAVLPATQTASGLEMDERSWQARLDGVLLDLTPVEFRMLAIFAKHAGRAFTRNQLLDNLYDDHRIVTDRAVDTHVKNLRRKLAVVRPEQDIIQSVYGVGYRLQL